MLNEPGEPRSQTRKDGGPDSPDSGSQSPAVTPESGKAAPALSTEGDLVHADVGEGSHSAHSDESYHAHSESEHSVTVAEAPSTPSTEEGTGHHDEHGDYHHHHDEHDHYGGDNDHHNGGSGGDYGAPPATLPLPEPGPEEEGGGPIKSFLEHLEDLRWMLIKIAATVMIAMCVALGAADKLVYLLTWPLDVAQRTYERKHRTVPVVLGTNSIGKLDAQALLADLPYATNREFSLKFSRMGEGTNVFFAFKPDFAPPQTYATKALVNLKIFGPLGSITIALKLAFYGGLVMAAPFCLYFIAQFVFPALKFNEKKFIRQAIAFGTGLFVLGVLFCYFILIQVCVLGIVQFSSWLGFGTDEWRAEEYITFVCKFMLAMGACFELPIVVLTIVKLGFVDRKKLVDWRMYIYVGLLIISGIASPTGDPITMFLFALPLMALYEMCIVIAWFWERAARKRAKDAPPAT
jgi:sec-independent protein translocase protein TatC